MCTWNLRGKPITLASDYIHLSHDPEVILLQEVGLTESLTSASNEFAQHDDDSSIREVAMGLEHDLYDFRVFCGRNESHLAQVIAVDAEVVGNILLKHSGKRFLAVGFISRRTGRRSMVVSAHFPHSGCAPDEFFCACNDLTTFISRYSQYDFILGGDWNCEPGDDRFDMLAIPLTLLGASLHCPHEPTRFGKTTHRRLDFFILAGRGFVDDSGSGRVHAEEPRVFKESALALGSDHALVIFDLAIDSVDVSSPSSRRKSHKTNNACKKWCVDNTVLRESLPTLEEFSAWDAGKQWTVLVQMAVRASYQVPSHKFRDSKTLKAMCSERRVTSDSNRRAALTKIILAQRQLEREEWCQRVLVMASEGGLRLY